MLSELLQQPLRKCLTAACRYVVAKALHDGVIDGKVRAVLISLLPLPSFASLSLQLDGNAGVLTAHTTTNVYAPLSFIFLFLLISF
jgi:hypothetical protein